MSLKFMTLQCYVISLYCDLIDMMLVYIYQDIFQAYDSVI